MYHLTRISTNGKIQYLVTGLRRPYEFEYQFLMTRTSVRTNIGRFNFTLSVSSLLLKFYILQFCFSLTLNIYCTAFLVCKCVTQCQKCSNLIEIFYFLSAN